MRYFITFSCYGTRLHGDEAGSVDKNHNQPGGRVLDEDSRRESFERGLMAQEPYVLDEVRRNAVLEALRGVCLHRGWGLFAAHVRSNHVHVVVEGECSPEKILNDLKAYASRRLNLLGCDAPGRKRWSRHGSTRWLWKREDVQAAIAYVVDEQGEAMAVYRGEDWE